MNPSVIVLAGPNGAGKTTAAPRILRDRLRVPHFAQRVRLGGHDVPGETIRRRYTAGLQNFFALFRPIATTWRMYDNSGEQGRRLIAAGRSIRATRVLDRATWQQLIEIYER